MKAVLYELMLLALGAGVIWSVLSICGVVSNPAFDQFIETHPEWFFWNDAGWSF